MKPDLPSQLRTFGQRLGLAGRLGAVLLALTAWGVWQVLPGMRDEIAQEEAQIQHVRAQLQKATQQADAPDGASAAQDIQTSWQQAWTRLPSRDRATDLQTRMLQAADGHGLTTASVQYQGEALRHMPSLWRQRITLPVEGSYPAVRAWLQDLLREPGWSIDALDLSRTDTTSDAIKARLTLSLWWRLEPGP